MGVVSLIGLAVNANSISDLSKDQDSICTVVSIELSSNKWIIQKKYKKYYNDKDLDIHQDIIFRWKTLELHHFHQSLLQQKLILMQKEWWSSITSLQKLTVTPTQIVNHDRVIICYWSNFQINFHKSLHISTWCHESLFRISWLSLFL